MVTAATARSARPIHSSEAATELVIQDVTGWLTTTGSTVARERLAGGVRGYTDQAARRIALAADADPSETARVLLHEACHGAVHHAVCTITDGLTTLHAAPPAIAS